MLRSNKMFQSSCIFEPSFVSSLTANQSRQKHALFQRFWPNLQAVSQQFDESSYEAFLEYVVNELQQVRHHRDLFAAQDIDSTFVVIQKLKDGHQRTCGEILEDLSLDFLNFEPAAIRRSLELSTRLWLSLNTQSPDISVGPIFADEIALEWKESMSLDTIVKSHFVKCVRTQTSRDLAKIEPAFTAAYLVNTCGMKLSWTDNIAGHLKLDLGRLTLSIYRHKVCLVNHLEDRQGCPFPEELLGEMLDTMNLLFPFGDVATKQLLFKEGQRSMYSLGSCSRSRKLDLSHYQYFGDELQYLIDSFDKTPRTWKQLALDRRNKLEWSAFWITVMVAVLTVVSIPYNIIQATYSVKAYNVAVAQGNNGVLGEL